MSVAEKEQSVPKKTPNSDLFVAVIGLHSSGSSCLAGVLYHLGLHLGNHLVGFYGNDPERSCGFEATGLLQLCHDAVEVPNTEIREPRQLFIALRQWIADRQKEAVYMKTIAAGKFPMLCQMGLATIDACGSNLRVINIDRDLNESIASLSKRFPDAGEGKIAAHQKWLWQGKIEFKEMLQPNQHLSIEFKDLLSDPGLEITRICQFLEIQPSREKIERAAQWVDPTKRHVDFSATEPG